MSYEICYEPGNLLYHPGGVEGRCRRPSVSLGCWLQTR
ncbi:unnamed protein product [Linum tenue]|uniref:Uncharacterized protein n=1 Tax=Linum tenue TaxID=586396 RepID=A0AAV0LG16_9ROSI|nr:unnamed protein product [Linum tenue]